MSFSRVALTAVVLLITAAVAPAEDYWVYIGTYTGGQGGSKGIYRAKLQPSGELTDLQLAAEVISPSFLAVSPNHQFLYAVGETAQAGDKKEGAVHAYQIDAKTGALKKLNDDKTGGAGPCHLAVNRTGKYLIVANYGGGSTALFKIKDDGSIERQCDFVQHKGKSVNPSRQEGPHAHCAVFNVPAGEDTEFAYVVDLGLDQVLMFKLDPEKGKLAPLDPPFVKLPDGSGPRHIAFNPNSGKAYVCGELDSTIITLRHNRNGILETWKGEGAVLSTLPADVPDDVRKKNSTAEIVVHPSRGTVFVSNRGHDSIATFQVKVEFTTAGPHLTAAGDNDIKTPRNFNVDPTGHWILVANQDGGTVRVIEWSNSQGNGKMTGLKVDVKSPVCVTFVPVEK
jgi:6-phosphogluconolactonase